MLGAGEILLTSMDRDGTKRATISRSRGRSPMPLQYPLLPQAGWERSRHMVEGIRDGHATAVLAASIFHFGEHSVREAKSLWRGRVCRCGSIL